MTSSIRNDYVEELRAQLFDAIQGRDAMIEMLREQNRDSIT